MFLWYTVLQLSCWNNLWYPSACTFRVKQRALYIIRNPGADCFLCTDRIQHSNHIHAHMRLTPRQTTGHTLVHIYLTRNGWSDATSHQHAWVCHETQKNKPAYSAEDKHNFVLRSTGLWQSVELRVHGKRCQVPERLPGTYLAADITRTVLKPKLKVNKIYRQ